MMTTVHRRRKTRRFRAMRGSTSFPPSWLPLPPAALPATGNAKPGRGGRRKRRRRAAGVRAYHVYRAAFVRSPLRPLLEHLERWYRLWPPRPREAWDLGRRERRRRAKLRRRRARARAEGRPTPIAAPMPWEAALLEYARGEDLDRMAEMFGLNRTPGA